MGKWGTGSTISIIEDMKKRAKNYGGNKNYFRPLKLVEYLNSLGL